MNVSSLASPLPRIVLTLFAVFVGVKTPAVAAQNEETVPWTVFADEAPVRAEPLEEAEQIGVLAKGSRISGEYYLHEATDEEWLAIDYQGRTGYVSRTAIHRVHPENRTEGNLPYGEEQVNRWWGLPLDYEPDDLETIPSEFARNSNRTYQLRREARDALVEMLKAAKSAGVNIRVASAYRSGEYQRGLYERAIERKSRAQRSSAPPGHSEHQLGVTVDLTDAEGRYGLSQAFGYTPESAWLEANAARFGFRRSYYPENVKETGYISEPWHWRYVGVENLREAESGEESPSVAQ